jgi:hypothetical protein
MMRLKILLTLTLLAGSAFAAQLPRQSPEFVVHLPDGKDLTVSSYHGKVLCLVFILTT